ncbi:hypothetical protein M9H77_21783 [Catharanthus roseus]|uniref:Uncharacterized protein n=1 Tax=Catharanthus roseus TaxID=4058 RepID=A0ACC0AQ19_CATRO|nr:hypothetical protein M9H77_21783 [Catharanthus roseus]
MKAKTYLIINQYQRSRTADRRQYVTLACEHGGAVKKYTKPVVDDEEEEIPIKRRGPYGTKICDCPFKLKGEQMTTSENWQLLVHKGRHNHKIAVYHHAHAQAERLTEEQLQQTEQFRKSHVAPHNILRFFREQDIGCAVSTQKIYNVVAKIKNNRMQGRNTVFYRNSEESNVLSDIVIAHPTSIVIIRIRHIDQNVLATLTEMVKDEEVAQQFMNGSWNKLINEINEEEYQRKLEVLKSKWQSRSDFLHYLFSTWLNPFVHKFCKVWTSQVLHFGVATTNRAESEHSVLKLWLSTCHGDLDTVLLNIDSLIEEISKLKEKFAAKSNAILKNISNKISHLALKKDMD